MNKQWPTEPVRRMIYEAGIREGRKQAMTEARWYWYRRGYGAGFVAGGRPFLLHKAKRS